MTTENDDLDVHEADEPEKSPHCMVCGELCRACDMGNYLSRHDRD